MARLLARRIDSENSGLSLQLLRSLERLLVFTGSRPSRPSATSRKTDDMQRKQELISHDFLLGGTG